MRLNITIPFLIIVISVILLTSCKTEFLKVDCSEFSNKTNCEISNALLADDFNACDSIEDDSNLCKAYFGVKNSDYSICDSLERENKKICYLGIIFEEQDFRICYKHSYAYEIFTSINQASGYDISNPTVQQRIDACNSLIISQNKDIDNICEQKPKDIDVIGSDWKETCLDIQKEQKRRLVDNIEDCYNLEYPQNELCIAVYGIYNYNTSVCSIIEDQDIRNSACLFEAAIYSDDILSCPKTEQHPVCVARILNK
jgi:hypothetical protein